MPINNKLTDSDILPMAIADIPQILCIETAAHSHPWSEKLFLSNFGKRYINHVIMVNDQVAGYFIASYVAGEVTLLNIAVAPNFQGKGLGRALLLFLKAHAQSLSQQEIWLEVRASNHVAIALYQVIDFVEVDIRSAYYPTDNGREDAIIMCCYL